MDASYSWLFAVKADASYGNADVSLAWSRTAHGADLQNPWSGNPGYSGAMIQKFNRAGEQALLARLSYDFRRLGVEGLTAYALFVHGASRAAPTTRSAVPNENEVDLDVGDRKSTRLNSSHQIISYAVF